MLIKTVLGKTPAWGDNCFIAENATLIGDLIMGDQCSVWFQAVIRGDVNKIRLGNRVNIQDGAIIHATYKTAPTYIGNDVSVGHNAIVHGCTIHDKVLIGMGSIVMDHCVVNSNSIIAAGSVVTQRTIIESGSVYAGIPAKKIKTIDQGLQKGEIERIASNYLHYSSWFKSEDE
jgi:carbonic anhydrase/acetyltransferase-like protein (isoleucine patch superfamily)